MTFSVVILSAHAPNLLASVQSVLTNEPELAPTHILVVDDGARHGAEAHLPGIRWVPGKKPFVYARNANLGIRASGTDVILLNDDARLMTPRGFTLLAQQVEANPEIGVCSAGVLGIVGNANQLASNRNELRTEARTLAFVCVYLRTSVYERVGPLDERFTGYGFEDNDYCARVLAAGLRLGVWDGCIVDHSGSLPSTFRTQPHINTLLERNQRLFRQKWQEAPVIGERSVDLMYLACNRLEFTRESFSALLTNTDWEYVHELFVCDDGSVDGTREWLEHQLRRVPATTRFVRTRFGSPVAAMVHFIESARAPILAKTDNDAMLPPGWLRQSVEVLARHPALSLLGIEAMYPHVDDLRLERSYTPAEFISGLGLYRREAFRRRRPRPYEKWFGLEEWQMLEGPSLIRGWITPAIPVFLLDRLPFEPWRRYSETYIRRGWQRSWPKYDVDCALWQWRWPSTVAPLPAVLSDDTRFLGALRVKNEAARIFEVILQVLHLCGRVFVLDDHSTDETVSICRSFGHRVVVFPSPFEGLDEARDKNYLLARIIEAGPEWVLWVDGDEVLERTGPEKLREAASNAGRTTAYALRVAYVWDDPEHVRMDGIFGNFKRLSFFRLGGQPVNELHFPESGRGGNFHCGNVPKGLAGEAKDLDVRLKHFGYMSLEQRQAKYAWYAGIDPSNVAEDNYRHLAGIPGARLAPGPPRIVPWVE